jgi:chromosome segregation ATPase
MMTTYSISTAAAAVGRDRASIRRAIAAGKISAVRDAASGQWRVEASELHRVYPPVPAHERDEDDAPSRSNDSDARLAVAEARVGEMQEAARMRDETIADLRRRLDRADHERERLQAQLGEALTQVRLLTDQRMAAPAATIVPPPARRWWGWGRG